MRIIDADALKEKLINLEPRCANKFVQQGLDDGLHYYMPKIIDEEPTIDAEPVKHGRWVMRGGKRYCSECQKRACVTRDSDDFWYTVGTDYCPNCGSRMDLGVFQYGQV